MYCEKPYVARVNGQVREFKDELSAKQFLKQEIEYHSDRHESVSWNC
jgi:hypothetical protein